MMKYQLINPTLVPINLLGLLESVGLDTTEKVHQAIEENALQAYKGIGPSRERVILHYYTTKKIKYPCVDEEVGEELDRLRNRVDKLERAIADIKFAVRNI